MSSRRTHVNTKKMTIWLKKWKVVAWICLWWPQEPWILPWTPEKDPKTREKIKRGETSSRRKRNNKRQVNVVHCTTRAAKNTRLLAPRKFALLLTQCSAGDLNCRILTNFETEFWRILKFLVDFLFTMKNYCFTRKISAIIYNNFVKIYKVKMYFEIWQQLMNILVIQKLDKEKYRLELLFDIQFRLN